MEAELTGQLDMLAKQTKRVTERRADLETRTSELEKEFETRLARETESLRDELARTQKTYEQRAALLQQQVDQNSAGAAEWTAKETQLQSDLATAGQQLAAAREELVKITTALSDATRAKDEQAQHLAQQIASHEQEAAEWQKQLEAATAPSAAAAQTPDPAVLEQARALQSELDQTRARLAQAEARQKTLEQQLAGAGTAGNPQLEALTQQVEILDKQRNDLAAQLFTIQDTLRRQTDESLLAKNSMEGELLTLRRRHAELEAERKQWKSQHTGNAAGISPEQAANLEQVQASLGTHRDRLLRQARAPLRLSQAGP